MNKARPLLFLVMLLVFGFGATYLYADDFDTARDQRFALLAGTPLRAPDAAVAEKAKAAVVQAKRDWSGIETQSTRTELWSDLAFPSSDPRTLSAHMTSTYARLRSMALAYAMPGSSLKGDSRLLAATLGGVAWMSIHVYSENAQQVGNWWDWQIGTPLALDDIMVLLYSDLDKEQIAQWARTIGRFAPSRRMTGANLMWTSEILSLTGVLTRNAADVDQGVRQAPTVLTFVTSGDGFYEDGSFIQHAPPGFAYNGGYGLSLMSDLIEFTAIFQNTRWALSRTIIDAEIDRLERSFAPFMVRGALMDTVRGREVSRAGSTSINSGRRVITAYLNAADFAPPSMALHLRRLAKHWLQQAAMPVTSFDACVIPEIHNLLHDKSIEPLAEPTGFHVFAGMDRVVYSQKGWTAALALTSSRHGNFESINSENLKGWHTGDGMLYLYDNDSTQYESSFWPTVDSYLLQGTTVADGSTEPAGKAGTSAFAGGIPSLDGAFGLAAMAIAPASGSVSGKKAWFFLDNQIVCLGTGIASRAHGQVTTVIANRRLTALGTNPFTTPGKVDRGVPAAETAPWLKTSSLQYFHIEGNTSQSSFGAYFSRPVQIELKREARSHSWNEINRGADSKDLAKKLAANYLIAALRHDMRAQKVSYDYTILPGITGGGLAAYASAPEVQVLSNDSIAQAISDKKLGLTAIVFWQKGTVAGVTVSAPALVLLHEHDSYLDISLADPTQNYDQPIHLTVERSASEADRNPHVAVKRMSPLIELEAQVSDQHGRAIFSRLKLK